MLPHLFVFDVDGTLAAINQPVSDELVCALRTLSRQHRVVLASGKPFCYLAGFARQLGLSDCAVIAENGALAYFGATFPPDRRIMVLSDNAYLDYVATVREQVLQRFAGTVWLQPSEASLTVFPLSGAIFPELVAFAHAHTNAAAQIYVHADSIDFTPTNIDKGVGLRALLKELPGQKEGLVYAFGDGENDLPLLRAATCSFVVGSKLPLERGWKRVPDISDLAHILPALSMAAPLLALPGQQYKI
jgi:hydroxymethylpyrimidine pyrophosphatase-like HAD family hydrolase